MYSKLTNEEKKDLIKKYSTTKKGEALSANLNRLVLEGVFCLGASVVTLIAIFVLHLQWWYWFFVGLTLICGILYLVGQHKIRMKEYNKFLKNGYKSGKNKLTKSK